MNILICDDQPDEALALNKLLRQSGFDGQINSFYHGSEALDFVQNGPIIDLCFLDIVMPEMTGIQLAQTLRKNGYTGALVFLSLSKEFGPESYTVNAFSYLLKPITLENVSDILKRVEHLETNKDQAGIALKIAGATKVILYRHISYIEVIRHTVYFHLTDGSEIRANTTFATIASKLLSESRFIQCHRSYIVNMQNLAEISERLITTYNGKKLPISRTYKNTRTTFYKWKFGEEG